MNEWDGVKEVKKEVELENMLSFLGQNEENDNSFSSEVRKSFSEENTNTPISINSLDVEDNEIRNNLEELNEQNENFNEQIEDNIIIQQNENENDNDNIELINPTEIPEVVAQPLNFFNTNIPITMEQYLSMQNTIRNLQHQNEENENVDVEKYYICNCIPCNKETTCIDKTCEFCICICCPLNLGCKVIGLGIFSILSVSALIEKTFCPDFGKTVFGINDLVSMRCPLSIIEYFCGKKNENNEHDE